MKLLWYIKSDGLSMQTIGTCKFFKVGEPSSVANILAPITASIDDVKIASKISTLYNVQYYFYSGSLLGTRGLYRWTAMLLACTWL